MATDDSFGQFEQLLREQIEPRVHDMTLRTDDISWQLLQTMQPIDRAGRRKLTDGTQATGAAGWMAEWRIRLQRAGLLTGGKIGGTTWEMAGGGSNLPMSQGISALYPDPTKVPARAYLAIAVFLKRIKGSLTINRDQIMADLVTNPIEEIAADYTQDVVERLRRTICAHFWSDGSAHIAQVNNASGVNVVENQTTPGGLEVAVDAGTCYRFEEGQRIVAGSNIAAANYGSSPRVAVAGSVNDAGVMRVVNIDRDSRTIYLESEQGEGTIALSDNDVLMDEGVYDFTAATVNAGTLAPNGIESLVINSGTFPGTAHDVDHYGALKGWVSGTAGTNVDPTTELISEVMDKITDSETTPPSVVIAESSVWTRWAQLERAGFAQYQVPQGAPFQASGGVSGPVITHQNHAFSRFSSSLCRENALFGLTPETFVKFMPIPGEGVATIKWFFTTGVMSGTPSIFGPVTSGARLSEMAQAPFDVYCEFGLKEPLRNFRIQGVHSQRSAS